MQTRKNQILDRLPQLPTLPAVVQEIVASFNNSDLNSAWLANKIAQDQGLSVRVLRLANSSFYGLPRHVGSIQDAVTVMGFSTIRSIVLSAGMMCAFPITPGSLFDQSIFWQRSFRVATTSMALAKCLRLDNDYIFTAAMFHDIGQLILHLSIPQRFDEVLQQVIEKRDLLLIEHSMLGFNHAELGADVVNMWNFPHEIEQVVRFVHQPSLLGSFSPLVSIVHLATLLDDGISGEALMDFMPRDCRDRMQITWERIESCLPQNEQLHAAAKLMMGSSWSLK